MGTPRAGAHGGALPRCIFICWLLVVSGVGAASGPLSSTVKQGPGHASCTGSGPGCPPRDTVNEVTEDALPAASLFQNIRSSQWATVIDTLVNFGEESQITAFVDAIQAQDDKGFTVTHLLSCAGKAQLLAHLLHVASRITGPGADAIREVALETASNPLPPKRERPLAYIDGEGVFMHGHLELHDPHGWVQLFAGTTPIECAAAQGHFNTIKLLIQSGAQPARAFEYARAFSYENQLFDAVRAAHAEGCWATPHVFLPTEASLASVHRRVIPANPLNKPRARAAPSVGAALRNAIGSGFGWHSLGPPPPARVRGSRSCSVWRRCCS